MVYILKKDKTRLRVKEHRIGTATAAIDIVNMPDGHVSCAKCSCPYFEFWIDKVNHKATIGCIECGWSNKILFPLDVDLAALPNGRFTCYAHNRAGSVIIKNWESLCVGCKECASQSVVNLKTKSNLVLM